MPLVLFFVRRHVPPLHTSIVVPEVHPSAHLNVVSASLTHPGNYTNAAGGELMNKWEDITAVALINDILTNEYMQDNTGDFFLFFSGYCWGPRHHCHQVSFNVL